MEYQHILKRSNEQKKQFAQFLKKASRQRGIEKHLPDLHQKTFEKIDCLKCAGCCKNISPRFKTPDIKRIAKFMWIRESVLIENYLLLDNDGDYVVKTSPCPFLLPNNHCSIYEARPGDCRKYPYTDSGDFFAYTNTTLLNTNYCPAVVSVLEQLMKIQP